MADATSGYFFEVLTPLGFRVRTSPAYWETIVSTKHPSIKGRESDIQSTLAHPEEVRQSRSDNSVHLFYRAEKPGRWFCAVA